MNFSLVLQESSQPQKERRSKRGRGSKEREAFNKGRASMQFMKWTYVSIKSVYPQEKDDERL